MKRLTIAILALALLWSGYWWVQVRAANTAIDTWFDARRAAGWEASYSARQVRGFPNRVDVTFTDLLLADPRSGLVYEAPFLQIFRLVYEPDHVILAFPEQQVLSQSGKRVVIDSTGLLASAVVADGMLVRSNLEASTLSVSGDGESWAVSELTAALLQADANTRYRLAIQADALATSQLAPAAALPESVRGLQLDLHADVSGPIPVDTPDMRPSLNGLDVRVAEYRYGDLQLRAAGDVDIDPDGRLDGRLNLRAENWREIVRLAQSTGYVPDELANTLEQGLGLLTGLSGSPDTLDLPLSFRQGRMLLGPIPLGDAPRIRLP